METLIALAPLLVCPLMMLFMGGGVARVVKRIGGRSPRDGEA
jgi:hypothetical protein